MIILLYKLKNQKPVNIVKFVNKKKKKNLNCQNLVSHEVKIVSGRIYASEHKQFLLEVNLKYIKKFKKF